MRALRSRRTLVDGKLQDATVIIEDGHILEVASSHSDAMDMGDLALLPGLVDTHVHINEPGRTEWEGFETASQAAAAGGITTIVDMPLNCIPVTTTVEALQIKLAEARPRIWVDAGFWGGVVPGNASELAGLAAGGALGAKAFTCHSGIDDFPASDRATLKAAMVELKRAGVPLLVHAELEGPVGSGASGDPDAYETFLASRPSAWEDNAIAMVIELCEETGCHAHIVHLSSATALGMLAEARGRGVPITAETCPHYLCLQAEEVPRGATEFKCCPPIREAANREALWQGLLDGHIDVVVSDHSPCTPHLKVPERGDFMDAWGGISSLQLGLSSIWTEASKRGISLEQVCHWMCEAPARVAGLPRKGRIAAGYRADLVAFNPEATWILEAEQLFHRHKVSPYVGREFRGRVARTWLGGDLVWDGTNHHGPHGRVLLEHG